MYKAGTVSTSLGSSARNVFSCSFCVKEIDSTPPATTTSTPSTITCFAAVAIAMSPEEHPLSTTRPGTSTGRSALNAAWRAILNPVVPCDRAHPRTTSSTLSGSMPARSTAELTACAANSWACVLLKAPRYALPIGVRANATITASRIGFSLERLQHHFHFGSSTAGNHVALGVQDLIEMVTDVLGCQRRFVVPACESDEEACDPPSTDCKHLSTRRHVLVSKPRDDW